MTTGDKQQNTTTRRPHYRTQQLLTAEQLNGAQAYHAEQMRRLVHGLAGTGVVYGFDLKVQADAKETCAPCIEIGCGLAFDHLGRQLFWAGGALSAKEFMAPPEAEGRYLLQVHYAERRIKAPQLEECGEEAVQWVEEGGLFSLQALENDQCPTANDACEKLEDPCTSLRDYVCRRLTDGELCPKEPTDLCARGDDEWWYDLRGGIALGCVEVCDLGQKCDPRFGFVPGSTELCDARPFVYRNPLLFDLQRACHVALVYVAELKLDDWGKSGSDKPVPSWLNSDRDNPVPWEQFEEWVKQDGVTIRFSDRVQAKTLNDASVFLTAIVEEPESYFQDVLRIPMRMDLLDDKDGFAWGVRLLFSEEFKGGYESPWIQRQIDDRKSRFAENEAGSLIELTIRTSLIRDNCAPPRLLDGRPLDIPKDDPAQAMPGVDFVAKFFVEQKGWSERHESHEQSATDTPVQGDE
jgi:hypothetical protein